MLGLLKALFGILDQLSGWLRAKQEQDAGQAIQKAKVQEEVLKDVEAVKKVDNALPDPERDKRLQDRFDRDGK